MTGIIIQARKGSTRLPNKMILPFYKGKGILELMLEKLLMKFPKEQLVLATTVTTQDDELAAIGNALKINVYRGSENNVLSRFIESAKEFKFDNIIRVCADNPFLDISHIHKLITEIELNKHDYISYKTENGLPAIKSHLGLFTEAVTLKALMQTKISTKLPLYLEHVTNYVYENKDQFKIKLLNLPYYMDNTSTIRLTLDTLEDFELEKELFKNTHYLSNENLITHLKKNKSILNRMANQINKNFKV